MIPSHFRKQRWCHLRLNDAWRVNGTYSYLDTTARAAFERGMHGGPWGSLGVTYRPSLAHEFTVASRCHVHFGQLYDRYDVVYNYNRKLGITSSDRSSYSSIISAASMESAGTSRS